MARGTVDGFTLKGRAVAIATCAGAAAFLLALAGYVAFDGRIDNGVAARALFVALGAAGLCWFAARHAIAGARTAIDAAIARLGGATQGDLESAVPDVVRSGEPALAEAMDGLFRQLHANLDSAHRLAMFDPVTALPNRTNFRRSVERALEERVEGAHSVLYFIDLDRFKSVNDTLGHATGDVLLGMVASRLRMVADRFAAQSDARPPLIGRLAGDEFTMFFPELRDARDAERIGGGILAALSESFDLADREISIGASIGIAMSPGHGATLHELMRAADTAMYHAKARGRGRTEHFSEELANEIAERVRLEAELRDAIDRDEFRLFFQPQVNAARGEIVGAEALLRWRHPDGLRLPGAFIARAEQAGLIVEIGEWVVRDVAATIARWGRLGLAQRLAMNVSQREIDDADFFRQLRAALAAARAPAHLLELEITETMAMQCSDAVLDAVAQLRADGASVAIDDFGTGYSNLARLRALPIDRVKLDRSVTAQVAEEPAARTIAQAVIGLVHGLGCEAVAEGIETEAQATVLRVLGCDILQGYAVAPPMDEAAFLDWTRGRALEAVAG